MRYPYTLREPIASDVDREGIIVSRHCTADAARRALDRRQAGAFLQGGFTLAYIHDDRAAARVYPTACPGCGANHAWDHTVGCRWFCPRPGQWDRLDQR